MSMMKELPIRDNKISVVLQEAVPHPVRPFEEQTLEMITTSFDFDTFRAVATNQAQVDFLAYQRIINDSHIVRGTLHIELDEDGWVEKTHTTFQPSTRDSRVDSSGWYLDIAIPYMFTEAIHGGNPFRPADSFCPFS